MNTTKALVLSEMCFADGDECVAHVAEVVNPDGRNRAAACSLIGIEPTTVGYDGDDFAEYVIAANVHRRHMSTGARAMATALVLAADGKREGGRWKRGSVVNPESGISEGKTWQNLLINAGLILDHAPDLAPAVVAGQTSLDEARRRAEEARDAERAKLAQAERIAAIEAEAESFITERDPDLAAQVGGPFHAGSRATGGVA